jgi:quinol monooxygenase YgiN
VDLVDRDSFLACCSAAVNQARRVPGCLDYSLSPDTLDMARVNVFERWASEAALRAFRGSGPEGHRHPDP